MKLSRLPGVAFLRSMQSYFQFYTDKLPSKRPGEVLAEKFVHVQKTNDISQYSYEQKH